jgi:homoserine dehydrogenase
VNREKINIGLLGLGTVGSAVAAWLQRNSDLIAKQAGREIKIKKVCDLRKVKKFGSWVADPYEIINDDDIAIVVEAIGGVNPSLKYIFAALDRGKHVVTSNKEVIAKHIQEILSRAAKKKVAVLFEGAVGGGIPILHALARGLAANQISEIFGIVNGTTNYILSKMTEEGMSFSEALERAKQKGFAEARPESDIEGYDAQYKTVILAASAWGARVSLKNVSREGISGVTQEDIRYAGEIGYCIKPLAAAKKINNKLSLAVHPALISKQHPLAAVMENYNAIYVKGRPVGEVMFYGPGAGGDPTASAVVSDIIDIAKYGSKVAAPQTLTPFTVQDPQEAVNRYYLRLKVPDRFGVLAQISKVLADKQVSIQAVLQKETAGKIATLIIILHEAKEKSVRSALRRIEKLPVVHQISSSIRII